MPWKWEKEKTARDKESMVTKGTKGDLSIAGNANDLGLLIRLRTHARKQAVVLCPTPCSRTVTCHSARTNALIRRTCAGLHLQMHLRYTGTARRDTKEFSCLRGGDRLPSVAGGGKILWGRVAWMARRSGNIVAPFVFPGACVRPPTFEGVGGDLTYTRL